VRAFVAISGLLITLATYQLAEARVVTADTKLTPEFKRLDKSHWKRWEKDEAKLFRKAMKRRELAECRNVESFQSPPNPYYALQPYFPVVAQESGTCSVRFNVNRMGRPTHIAATCSNDVYVASSEQTVSKWWFKALRDSTDDQKSFCGFEVKFTFLLEN